MLWITLSEPTFDSAFVSLTEPRAHFFAQLGAGSLRTHAGISLLKLQVDYGTTKGVTMKNRMFLLVAWVVLSLTGIAAAADTEPLRVGFFANVTHGQAILGKKSGAFEQKTGRNIDWKVFNAGPSAMEALLAGALDVAYVGPNPAVNAYFRSKGKALRIVAGVASGGAGLVVRKEARIRKPGDLRGRKVASPEYGNTQDIALRNWLKGQKLAAGKDVQVVPMKNPDILMLFQQKKLDAAWVPEPWLSRLIHDGGGELLLDERSLWPGGKFTTAVVVVRNDFLDKNRETVKRFLEAHIDITEQFRKQPTSAREQLNAGYAAISGKGLPENQLRDLFSRMQLTYDPLPASVVKSAAAAADLGFLPGEANNEAAVKKVFDTTLLNEILRGRKLKPISQ